MTFFIDINMVEIDGEGSEVNLNKIQSCGCIRKRMTWKWFNRIVV